MSLPHLNLSWEEEIETETPLGWKRNYSNRDDDNYLWFRTNLRPSDIVEVTDHRPQYEYTVTGRRRIKVGSSLITLGTRVAVNGKTVAIFKYEGAFYAIQNTCPHQGASLHLGEIEEIDGRPCVSCPRHKWPFSLEDGQCIIPVNYKAQCYPICVRKERDGSKTLYVGFTGITDTLFNDDSF